MERKERKSLVAFVINIILKENLTDSALIEGLIFKGQYLLCYMEAQRRII